MGATTPRRYEGLALHTSTLEEEAERAATVGQLAQIIDELETLLDFANKFHATTPLAVRVREAIEKVQRKRKDTARKRFAELEANEFTTPDKLGLYREMDELADLLGSEISYTKRVRITKKIRVIE